MGGGIRLNLGCGQHKVDGYVNVDKFAECDPDLVWDLEIFPWPWADDSVSEIRLIHVLEHLGRELDVFLSIMKELYRVCADDARIVVHVPHHRHDDFANDPTHVRIITPIILGLFDRAVNLEAKALNGANTPLALYTGTNFQLIRADIMVEKAWSDRVHRGELTMDQLNEAYLRYHNVAKEHHMVLKVVKADPAEC